MTSLAMRNAALLDSDSGSEGPQALLKQARFLIKAGLAPMAAEPLRKVIREAPGTPAAQERGRHSIQSRGISRCIWGPHKSGPSRRATSSTKARAWPRDRHSARSTGRDCEAYSLCKASSSR